MYGLTNCSFCNKTIWDEEFAEMSGVEGGCDCSSYRQYRYCHKSHCSN